MSEIEYEVEMALLHLDQDMDAQEAAMFDELNEQTGIRRAEAKKEQEEQAQKEMELLMTERMRKEHNAHWESRWNALKSAAGSLAATLISGTTPLVLPSLGPLAFTIMCLSASWLLYVLAHDLAPEVSWFMAHKGELT